MLRFLPQARSLGLATACTYGGVGVVLFWICASYGVLCKVMYSQCSISYAYRQPVKAGFDTYSGPLSSMWLLLSAY